MISTLKILEAWNECARETSENWEQVAGFAFVKSNAKNTVEVLEQVISLMKSEKEFDRKEFLEGFEAEVKRNKERRDFIRDAGLDEM